MCYSGKTRSFGRVFLMHANHDLKKVGFGVAGGLNERSVLEAMPQLLSDYPDLSWDAEGRFHKTTDGSLNMDEAKRYLQASVDVRKNC